MPKRTPPPSSACAAPVSPRCTTRSRASSDPAGIRGWKSFLKRVLILSMDFRDSEKEAAFRAEARAFLEANKPSKWAHPFDDDVDEHALLTGSKAWQRTLYENGWGAILWPKEYGGRGLGPIEAIIWNQELVRLGLGESIFVVGTAMAGPTIIAHGTAEQKSRYLEPLARGDEIWCQLFSEPGAGSDLAALSARAVQDGDHWVVSGQKTWCSGAHYADFGILLARSDPSVPKHDGITYFLLDMRAPGVEVRPLRQMSGGSHFNDVFLNDVRIPDANRLGPARRRLGRCDDDAAERAHGARRNRRLLLVRRSRRTRARQQGAPRRRDARPAGAPLHLEQDARPAERARRHQARARRDSGRGVVGDEAGARAHPHARRRTRLAAGGSGGARATRALAAPVPDRAVAAHRGRHRRDPEERRRRARARACRASRARIATWPSTRSRAPENPRLKAALRQTDARRGGLRWGRS